MKQRRREKNTVELASCISFLILNRRNTISSGKEKDTINILVH